MLHIDEQYLCLTTKEHINMQRDIFSQIIKEKKIAFKQNFRHHLIALGACHTYVYNRISLLLCFGHPPTTIDAVLATIVAVR